MDDEDKKLLLQIADTCKEIAESNDKILRVLERPQKMYEKGMAILGAGAAAGGAMSAIDLIIQWRGG